MPKKQQQPEGWNGGQLAALRRAAGFTQLELAQTIGVTRRMIAYYETESEHPPSAILAQLARTLRITTDQLLGVTAPDEPPRAPNRRVVRRIEKIEQLPKRDQDALLRTIDAFLTKTG